MGGGQVAGALAMDGMLAKGGMRDQLMISLSI